ncbi:exodeoxyribonuclease VII large subunit [Sphingomonas lacunae]|uniref:Exodeoxyribonuclease 7 large subunit n=1 Tax=Sphingomonas lacunae TaxID=2698828 RepID=A0A6M4ASX3_9SPHN|nr:exodeoxyribonuclease VII large subunit [Sphingomonas lacunae]QJQ32154.1 exodeoxyribonuclease VII large subunit [Sphingomonas lacunae]
MPQSVPFDDVPDESGRLVAQPRGGDNAAPLSVGELSMALKRMVEQGFGHVRVRGEISGFKRAASGHVYLALKDADALIDGVMWKGQAARIPFRAEDGLDVIATGKLTTYPGRSKYQIVIDSMELAGEGALLALLEKTKARLKAEGLFDRPRKRWPYIPRVIGVVTSPTGAVIRDILHRLADRFPTRVLIWPVMVQGPGSANQIAEAIRGFDALPAEGAIPRPDLVIVARGGGSIEDLWSFNEEIVVRAAADCSIPLISAVGHETDTTLIDFASDQRAPTPTAAAEMAVPVRADLVATVNDLSARAARGWARITGQQRERLDACATRLPGLDRLVAPHRQRLDDWGERLPQALRLTLAQGEQRFARAASALRPSLVEQRIMSGRQQLDGLWRLAMSLDPRRMLERGYALVVDGNGHVLTSAASARAAGSLSLTFADGDVPVIIAENASDASAPGHSAPSPRRPRGSGGAGVPGQPGLFD